MRFICNAKDKNLIGKNIAESLKKLRINIKNLRDMREHFDEYCEPGGGQKPQEFVTECQFASGDKIRTDSRWSATISPQEVLGGRIDIEKLAKALSEFLQELKDESLWILVPWKADELAKTVSSEIDRLQNFADSSLSSLRN